MKQEWWQATECSKCNYPDRYRYRRGFGFLSNCELCGVSLNNQKGN